MTSKIRALLPSLESHANVRPCHSLWGLFETLLRVRSFGACSCQNGVEAFPLTREITLSRCNSQATYCRMDGQESGAKLILVHLLAVCLPSTHHLLRFRCRFQSREKLYLRRLTCLLGLGASLGSEVSAIWRNLPGRSSGGSLRFHSIQIADQHQFENLFAEWVQTHEAPELTSSTLAVTSPSAATMATHWN